MTTALDKLATACEAGRDALKAAGYVAQAHSLDTAFRLLIDGDDGSEAFVYVNEAVEQTWERASSDWTSPRAVRNAAMALRVVANLTAALADVAEEIA